MRAAQKRRKPASARGPKRTRKPTRKPARKQVRRSARAQTRIAGVGAKAKGKSQGKAKRKVASRPTRVRPAAGRGKALPSKARTTARAAKPVARGEIPAHAESPVRAQSPKARVTPPPPRAVPAADLPGRNRKPMQPVAGATASAKEHGAPVVDRPATAPSSAAGPATEAGVTPGLPVPIASFTI